MVVRLISELRHHRPSFPRNNGYLEWPNQRTVFIIRYPIWILSPARFCKGVPSKVKAATEAARAKTAKSFILRLLQWNDWLWSDNDKNQRNDSYGGIERVGRRRKVYEISKFRSGSQGKQWNAIGVRVWGHDGALAEVEMKATKKAAEYSFEDRKIVPQ